YSDYVTVSEAEREKTIFGISWKKKPARHCSASGHYRNGLQHRGTLHGRTIARMVAASRQIRVPGHGLPHLAAADGERIGAGNGFWQGLQILRSQLRRASQSQSHHLRRLREN